MQKVSLGKKGFLESQVGSSTVPPEGPPVLPAGLPRTAWSVPAGTKTQALKLSLACQAQWGATQGLSLA